MHRLAIFILQMALKRMLAKDIDLATRAITYNLHSPKHDSENTKSVEHTSTSKHAENDYVALLTCKECGLEDPWLWAIAV